MVSDERGATAGRSSVATRLQGNDYEVLLTGVRQASAIAIKHGLTPVLHQHSGTYIEFEDEVEQMLDDTVDDGLQLCIDTGHFVYAGVDPVKFFADHRDRTSYLHFKDINPVVHQKVLSDGVAFFDAISLGVFCPVGQGMVDFAALAAELKGRASTGPARSSRTATSGRPPRRSTMPRPAWPSCAASASPTDARPSPVRRCGGHGLGRSTRNRSDHGIGHLGDAQAVDERRARQHLAGRRGCAVCCAPRS